jgi:hypothetical protein
MFHFDLRYPQINNNLLNGINIQPCLFKKKIQL